MRRTNRLITIVKSARLQHATLALFTLVVLAYAAIALRSIWRVSDRVLEDAASTGGGARPVGVAAVCGFGAFAVSALALAWMMSGTLDRQQRKLADLREREEQYKEKTPRCKAPFGHWAEATGG